MTMKAIVRATMVALCLALAACNAGGRPKNAPKIAEPVAAAPAVNPATFGKVIGGQYIVAPGDTLATVADRTNTPVRTLIQLNGLQPPYGLAAGMKLALQPGASGGSSFGSGDTAVDTPPPATPSGAISAAPLPSPGPVSAAPLPAPAAPSGSATVSTPLPAPTPTPTPLPAPATVATPTPLPAPTPVPAPAAVPTKPVTEQAALPTPTEAPKPAASVKTPAAPAKPAAAAPAASTEDADAATEQATEAVDAAVETAPAAGSGKGPFVWPVQGKIIGTFGSSKDGQKNDGINIAAPNGAPVVAAADGVVAYAGNELRGFGNMVLIRHDDGFVTAYAHNASLLVKKGDKVKRGQTIARVGATGSVFGPQLHFEIRKGTSPVDPMKYLGG
jgi:murein DD-endopeptidase MepM/ murein hydrolase activator NlpD